MSTDEDRPVEFEEAEARGTIPAFIASLADRISDSLDMVEEFEDAQKYLTRDAFVALADALELCPDHISDAQSCRDDDLVCHVTRED